MSSLSLFTKFGRYPKKMAPVVTQEIAVAYTRVSTKEQADNNMSLATQRATIDQYSERRKIPIAAYFGGSYESAKTDGRKEFQRMLDYIKKNKGKVKYIFVYALDRFSRTGGDAIALKNELRRDYGVIIDAVTQPADTSTPSGVLQQDVQLIFSHHDNELRKLRAVSGMRDKFAAGIWVTKPPQGYDVIKINGERRIVINEAGKKLRKAFEWKAQGMKNEEIILGLRAMGVKMYKQQLTKIFKNPFYCGIINHGLLEGRVVEGTHEKLVSREIFLKINGINERSSGYGVPHKKEQEKLPLKTFIKCDHCGGPFTGYMVKAKNLWYYKCQTIGCKCNRSAKQLHELFERLLNQYVVKEELTHSLKTAMFHSYYEMTESNREQEKILREQLAEVSKRIRNIEDKFYALDEMPMEKFQELFGRYDKERAEIMEELEKCSFTLSNLEEKIEYVVTFSSKLAIVWHSSDTSAKEKIQKTVFPNGIIYDREKGQYRTEKVNFVFARMARLQRVLAGNEKGDSHFFDDLSPSADWTGLEPATSAVTGRHSNQLNYQSVCYSLLGMQR